MERFWCLRYLEQSGRTSFEATVIRDELVRGTDLPLIVRLKAPANLPAKTPVTVNVESIDYWSIGGSFSLPSPPPEAPQVA
jgi:exoribonuclease-2